MSRLITAGVAAAVVAALAGCASNPEKIQAASVSPLQYRDYNCSQIRLELERVTKRTDELHGRLRKLSDDDAAQMAVGMILFWPALFFLEGGDGPDAAEYARLKGERDALQKVAVEKNCPADATPVLQQTSTQKDEAGRDSAPQEPAR